MDLEIKSSRGVSSGRGFKRSWEPGLKACSEPGFSTSFLAICIKCNKAQLGSKLMPFEFSSPRH